MKQVLKDWKLAAGASVVAGGKFHASHGTYKRIPKRNFNRRSNPPQSIRTHVQRGSESGSELDCWRQAEEEIRRAQEEAIDEASEESFPASYSPA